MGRGPEVREPHSCPARGFTGPEVWLQKGSTWAVCVSLTFPAPLLFLSFCQRLHVFGFSDGRDDIFVLFVCVLFFFEVKQWQCSAVTSSDMPANLHQ